MQQVVIIPQDTFRAEIFDLFKTEIAPLISSLAPQVTPPEELIDRRGAAKFFDVSLPTLDTWTRDGIITGYRIGAHIRYKRSELMQALTKIQAVDQTARR